MDIGDNEKKTILFGRVYSSDRRSIVNRIAWVHVCDCACIVMGKKTTFPRIRGIVISKHFTEHLFQWLVPRGREHYRQWLKKKKKANTHRHEIIWYDLVHLALMIIERNMRKIQASVIDLHSGKSRYREFCRLKRRKHEKWTIDNFVKGLLVTSHG